VKDWLWFLSSYSPLWAMLALRFDTIFLRILFVGLFVFGILIAGLVLVRGRSDHPSNIAITTTGDGGSEVSGYLAAYLLPFLVLPAPSVLDSAAYLIFLYVAGAVYVRSGLMQINPTVYILRRRVLRGSVQITSASGDVLQKEVFVITRLDRRMGERVYAELFTDRVFIDHGQYGEVSNGRS
jgi:hypothetical protein